MRQVSGHSFDDKRLPEAPLVLDVGCRDFGFARAILELRPRARVLALDPGPDVHDPGIPGVEFIRVALVGDDRAESGYAAYSTGEGNYLTEKVPSFATAHRVQCRNLVMLMARLGIRHWDLVKLDCEGEEFQILERWPGPVADQISVEFHDYTDRDRWGDRYYENLFAPLILAGYEVVQHELLPVGPGPSWGHWDSLLRIRR